MATGRKAFGGNTRASIVTAILSTDPPSVSSVQAASPPALDRLVRTCLARDPALRWQSARDVGLQLEAMRETSGESTVAPPPGKRRAASFGPWAVAGLFALVAAVSLWSARGRGGGSAAEPIRLEIPPPPKGVFVVPAEGQGFAVSPDGTTIAFIGSSADGPRRIYLRRLSELEARPLDGTEGASSLFFSPDGRSLGFFGRDKLKRVDIGGGAAVSICDIGPGIGRAGTWGSGGQILFAAVQGDAIYRVAADGSGPPEAIFRPDAAASDTRFVWPWFLPDGRRFLFLKLRNAGERKLMLGEAGKPLREIGPIPSRAEYVAPGYLVFSRDGALFGQRFDVGAARLSGAPFPIAPVVTTFFSTGWAAFATSAGGTIAYHQHENIRHLEWFDRSGRQVGTVGPPGDYLSVSLSPDGKRVAFSRALKGLGTYDVYIFDLERNVESLVVGDPDNSEFGPLWLPDGKSLFFSALASSTAPQLFQKDLATGQVTAVLPSKGFQQAVDVTRDGRTLAFAERQAGGAGFELWTMALTGDRRPVRFPYRADHSESLSFSPDGTAAAFLSMESGPGEAYVAPLSSSGERIRLSTDGAAGVRWSRDGKEILYLSGSYQLMSVPVRTTPALQVGKPVALFTFSHPDRAGPSRHAWRSFDVTPDGQRFLAVVPEILVGEQTLTVVARWSPQEKQ
jgi:eukaryotic-like serine/threonine-protein kinase